MRVLFTPGVLDFYYELEFVLFEKGYFSYKESADKYVADLFYDIETNLPEKRHKPAPKHYNKYGKGMFYAAFPKNKHTTWYAFFTKYEENGDIIYLVRYMVNNHTDAHHLYEGF